MLESDYINPIFSIFHTAVKAGYQCAVFGLNAGMKEPYIALWIFIRYQQILEVLKPERGYFSLPLSRAFIFHPSLNQYP